MKSILPDQYAVEKQFNSRMDNFFTKYEIGKTLRYSNFQKAKGFSCLDLFKFIFLLVFSGKNLYRTLQSEVNSGRPEKDTVYRFLIFQLFKKTCFSLYRVGHSKKIRAVALDMGASHLCFQWPKKQHTAIKFQHLDRWMRDICKQQEKQKSSPVLSTLNITDSHWETTLYARVINLQ
jgi:hypothetical protein